MIGDEILGAYKEKILKKYESLDLAHFSKTRDELSEKLRYTPIDEIFVDVDFREYGTVHERFIGCSAMLDDPNNKVILAELGRGKATFLKYLLSRKIDEKIIPVYWEWKNLYRQIKKEELLIDFDESEFVIHFKDQGKGIPSDLKDKIFKPFFSTDDKKVGIGLANVKKIFESLGGEIEEIGEENQGIHFKIMLAG